jgi:hypothetical protein
MAHDGRTAQSPTKAVPVPVNRKNGRTVRLKNCWSDRFAMAAMTSSAFGSYKMNSNPKWGSTTKTGVAVNTAHPRSNEISPHEPQRGSTTYRRSLVRLWNPLRVRRDRTEQTWGAPLSGDPRLRYETRSGLNRSVFPQENASKRCPSGLSQRVNQAQTNSPANHESAQSGQSVEGRPLAKTR